jgi:hypothetical protein
VAVDLPAPVVDRPEALQRRLELGDRASVKGRGWVPALMAAFSAGRPKESNPIGLSTALPCMVW